MLTPAQAENLVRENLRTFPAEDCALADAQGRILRGDISADRDLPAFDRATLDGYAVRTADLLAAANESGNFRVTSVQPAGARPSELEPGAGTCIEIMTGAVVPANADCIVPYEETARAADSTIAISTAGLALAAGHAIHRRGSDHRAGEPLVLGGTKLTGREIAVAAACGRATLRVSACPKIAVISTGDELVEVAAQPAAHQIRRSNDYALRATLLAAGYPQVDRFHFPDDRAAIEHRLWHVLAEYDFVLLSGGVSKGKFDFLPDELAQQGVQKIFHVVAQRPGKPLWFGRSPRGVVVFALPGNPVSAFTCLHRYVLPALASASGATSSAFAPTAVKLGGRLMFPSPLTYFIPVAISIGPDAARLATPLPTNTSGDFAALVGTDGFVELPADRTHFPAGLVVPFWPWV